MMPFFAKLFHLRRVPKEIPKQDIVAYREFFFRSDVAQSQGILILITVVIAIFGLSDYLLLGLSTEFAILEIVRLFIVILSIFVVKYIKKTRDFKSYDRLLFGYLLVFIVFSLFVNTTRLEDFAVQAVILAVSIFAVYLVLPTRFLNQAVLSSIYTLGETSLLFFAMQPIEDPVFVTVVFVLLFTNIIAALGSWRFNYYRWLIFKDLTELKKSERFMVIGQTAGMVGHDIRNPLQAITSDMYLIQEEINRNPNCPNEDIRESIESINENISYINKIVSDLQDYTRTLTLSKVPVKIIGVFRTAITNVPESIKTQLNVDPNLTITSDPTYLQRILNNLVTNAVQAMPKGGSLILEAKAAGDKVQITITDTGIGIPEDAKPNLFKPLFTTKAKGQGLGLAVVKRLVETMGGTISFESHVEEGTKFTLELPRNQ